MNVLPPIANQAETYIKQDPSPFHKYDDAAGKFTISDTDDYWRKACILKFDWINRTVHNGSKTLTPADLGEMSDKKSIENHKRTDVLSDDLMEAQ